MFLPSLTRLAGQCWNFWAPGSPLPPRTQVEQDILSRKDADDDFQAPLHWPAWSWTEFAYSTRWQIKDWLFSNNCQRHCKQEFSQGSSRVPRITKKSLPLGLSWESLELLRIRRVFGHCGNSYLRCNGKGTSHWLSDWLRINLMTLMRPVTILPWLEWKICNDSEKL